MDSALLASLSDREVAERWFPARPRERAEGYLHPDLDACVERKVVPEVLRKCGPARRRARSQCVDCMVSPSRDMSR